jgi:hypothetical protein
MKYSYDRTADVRIAQGGIASLDYLNLTQKAKDALIKLDEKFIGTDNYMGVAFFWNDDYKWWLRDAKAKVRRQVHAAFVKAKLKPDEYSPEHRAVVTKFFPDAKKKLEEMSED